MHRDCGCPVAAKAVAATAVRRRAVARVLPAVEATLATLAARSAHPRELERAARALAALTRTLRGLSALLHQRRAATGDARAPQHDPPRDVEAMRRELARKLDALVAARRRERAEQNVHGNDGDGNADCGGVDRP